jgi:hypothetical protein
MGKSRAQPAKKVLPLITVREAREVYGCSRSTVYRWIDRGRLEKVGNVPGHDDYQEQAVLLLQVTDEELVEQLQSWVERRAKRGKEPQFLSQRLDISDINHLAAAVREASKPKKPEAPAEEPKLPAEIAALLDRLSEESRARGELLAEIDRLQHRTPPTTEQIQETLREVEQLESSVLDPEEEAPPQAEAPQELPKKLPKRKLPKKSPRSPSSNSRKSSRDRRATARHKKRWRKRSTGAISSIRNSNSKAPNPSPPWI